MLIFFDLIVNKIFTWNDKRKSKYITTDICGAFSCLLHEIYTIWVSSNGIFILNVKYKYL